MSAHTGSSSPSEFLFSVTSDLYLNKNNDNK